MIMSLSKARSRTFRRHMLASTREPYPLGIEAVAAVNLFKVDLWQAARMAARVQSVSQDLVAPRSPQSTLVGIPSPFGRH